MPRPTKCRKVCHFPRTQEFYPVQDAAERELVVMTVDEYETIRLIDREGLSQEACSERMQIARTTVQKIYETARKKLADVLVDGRPLKIEGGEYRLCNGQGGFRGCDRCDKRRLYQLHQNTKGEHMKRIAVAYENGMIFQHFGHTEQFRLYDVEGGVVVSTRLLAAGGSSHAALAELLQGAGVDALICGGIGGGAVSALRAVGIRLYAGASGDADAAVAALLADKLSYDPAARCSRHGEHHGADCGGHGCGEPHEPA
ncbi:MAG: DUF134 domain-containing protein [Oscillospiraceae bacterium]|nr:DUF134 domain-containing protein [Oscillospiraceae bacterium]